jgi:hypothetical protein
MIFLRGYLNDYQSLKYINHYNNHFMKIRKDYLLFGLTINYLINLLFYFFNYKLMNEAGYYFKIIKFICFSYFVLLNI